MKDDATLHPTTPPALVSNFRKAPTCLPSNRLTSGLHCLRRPHAASREGTVEYNHEVVAKPRRHTPVIEPAHPNDLLLGRNDLHGRPARERIQHHIRVSRLLEGEPETRTPLRRRHFRDRLPRVQAHAVIARLRRLVLVPEIGSPLIFLQRQLAGYRHQRKRCVIADPRAGLVGLPDAAGFRIVILVIEGVARRPRVGRPSIHRERQRNSGILVPVGIPGVGIRPLQRIGQGHR